MISCVPKSFLPSIPFERFQLHPFQPFRLEHVTVVVWKGGSFDLVKAGVQNTRATEHLTSQLRYRLKSRAPHEAYSRHVIRG